MATGAILAGVFFLVAQGTLATALTNWEFYELLKPYITGGAYAGSAPPGSAYDAIVLPGGPNDELDTEHLVRSMMPKYESMMEASVGYHPRFHHIHGSCHCRKYDCSCCLTYTFKFLWTNLFTLKACGEVAYLPHETGVEMTITLNGFRVFHHKISLSHPPALCFGIPGLHHIARVCLEVYDVNLSTGHVCLRLKGEVNLLVKKFAIHWKLGCFRLRHRDAAEFMEMLKSGDILEIKEADGSDVTTQDLADAVLSFLAMKKSEDMSFTDV